MLRYRLSFASRAILPPGPPVFSSAPVLSSTSPAAGSLIYASTGLATNNPTYAPQWLRNGTPISGATNWFYEIQESDIGAQLSLRSTATNGLGSDDETSAAYTVIRAAAGEHISAYAQAVYNTATRRYDFVPDAGARVILVDGVGGGFQSGQIYRATTYDDARSFARGTTGDWILFPSGQTTVLSGAMANWNATTGNAYMGGPSATSPAVLGTYDPADPTNPAKWNRGPKHVFDATGTGRGVTILIAQSTRTAPRLNAAMCNLHFKNGPNDDDQQINVRFCNKGFVVDGCIFEGVILNVQGFDTSNPKVVRTAGNGSQTVFPFTLRGRSDLSNPYRVRIEQISNIDNFTELVEGVDYTITFGTPTDGHYPSCTITLLGSPPAATHQVACWVQQTSQPDHNMCKDIVVNSSAFMFGNSSMGGRAGNLYYSGVRDFRIQDCVIHRNGWGRDHTRTTPAWSDTASATGNGSQTVFSFPDARAKKGDLSNPWQVSIGGVVQTEGVGYTISVGSTDANDIAQGCTVTTTSPVGNGVTLLLNPIINGPDIYKHNIYVDDFVQNGRIWNTLCTWDAGNPKITGQCDLYKFTEVRNPMGFITDSVTSDDFEAWPEGRVFICDDHLQVESDHIMYPATGVNAAYRGWGPTIYRATAGSRYRYGILLRNSSAANGSQRAIDGNDNNSPNNGGVVPSVLNVERSVFAQWPGVVQTVVANTTKTFTANVWTDATNGTNTQLGALAPGELRTLIDQALAKDIHTTFRQEMGIDVVVDADDKVTEDNVLRHMGYNPNARLWNDLVRYHFGADRIVGLMALR